MTKKKKIFPAVLGIFICLILMFVAVCSFYVAIHRVEKGELPYLFGKGICSSNGIYDTVEDNALVLSNRIEKDELEQGKVVVFYDPTEKSDYRLFLGNILQVKEDGNVIIYPGSGRDTVTVTPELIRGEADYSIDDVGSYIKLLEGKYGVLIAGAASVILLVLIIILFGTLIGNAKVNRQIRRDQKALEDEEEYEAPKKSRKLSEPEPLEEEEETEDSSEDELDNSSNAFDFGFDEEPGEDEAETVTEPVEQSETRTDLEDENVRKLSEMIDAEEERDTEEETSIPEEDTAADEENAFVQETEEDGTGNAFSDYVETEEEPAEAAEDEKALEVDDKEDEVPETEEVAAFEDTDEKTVPEEQMHVEEDAVSVVPETVVLTAKSPVKETVESEEVPTELTVSYLRGSFKSDRVSFEISCDERSAETMKELIDQAARTKGRFGLFTSVSIDHDDQTVLKIWCQWEDISFVSDIVNQIKG